MMQNAQTGAEEPHHFCVALALASARKNVAAPCGSVSATLALQPIAASACTTVSHQTQRVFRYTKRFLYRHLLLTYNS
jgi:hypothetical protein